MITTERLPDRVKKFLEGNKSPHAAHFHAGLELQVMPLSEEQQQRLNRPPLDENLSPFKPYAIRIPDNAKVSPIDNTGRPFYSLAFAGLIGTTGWNWKDLRSEFVVFDFDAVYGERHVGSGLSMESLDAVLEAVTRLPYVNVYRSKSGNGFHIYVFFASPPQTANHSEHAALAKAVLAKMSADCGYDLQADVDVAGGNAWIWSVDAKPRGFELIHEGGKLDEVPFWIKPEPESPDCDSVSFDSDHQKLVGWLTSQGYYCAVDNNRLTAHTAALKAANDALGLRGEFETTAQGGDRSDKNCFCYPQAKGAWKVFRFNKAKDCDSWELSQNGWSWTWLNKAPGRKAKPDQSGIIVNLATEADELFHSPDGAAYVVTAERRDTMLVSDGNYANTLRLRYTEKTKEIAKRDWINNAIDQLEAIAVLRGRAYPVCLRVGGHNGRIYIDLANNARQIVDVGPEGWQIVTSAPVRFMRSDTMEALPLPEAGGSLDELRPIINVDDRDWPLFVGGLVMGFHPTGPYPVFHFVGHPGSAKTAAANKMQALVDPCVASGTAETKSVEDMMVMARHRWLVALDNLSAMPQDLSDGLCRLSTGQSYTRRRKYRDTDQTTFTATRMSTVTSIADIITQPDLLSRVVRFDMVPNTDGRKKTDEYWHAEFASVRARVFAALLNGVSSALRNYASVRVDGWPRMGNFARWATAAEEGLGLASGSFAESYSQNRSDVISMILEEDLPSKIRDVVNDTRFEGRPKELAAKIGWETTDAASKKLASELRKLTPALDEAGVLVRFDKSRGHGIVIIERKAVAKVA